MTTAQISERLVSFGGIKKPMASTRLGILLSKSGYQSVRRTIDNAKVRGWIVYQRTFEEVLAMKRTLLND